MKRVMLHRTHTFEPGMTARCSSYTSCDDSHVQIRFSGMLWLIGELLLEHSAV